MSLVGTLCERKKMMQKNPYLALNVIPTLMKIV